MHDKYVRSLPTSTPADEIRDYALSGFSAMNALAFAEALGSAPRVTGGVLAGPDLIDGWVCALMHTRANLSKGLALRFLEVGADGSDRDRDYQRFSRSRAEVSRRLVYARSRARAVREQLTEELRRSRKPTADAPTAALVSAHLDEYRALLDDHDRKQHGGELFTPPPGGERDPRWAVKVGILSRPSGVQFRELSMADAEEFKAVVAGDIRQPGGTEPLLREPALLPRWGEALRELRSDSVRVTGAVQAYEGDLPLDLWQDLPSDLDAARKRINQLRFLEAVLERLAEYDALMDRAAVRIAHGLELRRADVERGAQEELSERYSTELALYEALI